MVAQTLENWAIRDVGDRPHKLFLHFFESPVEILGEDGKVTALRTERTELDGTGNVRGTGRFTDWDMQSVYRAVGYYSEELPKLPFDVASGTVPHEAGRVIAGDEHMASVYVTGWIKRGPIGLIGHTKGDANETVACVLEDRAAGRLAEPATPAPEAVEAFLEGRNVRYTTWEGWHKLDAHEQALGAAQGRERIKVVEREGMLDASGAFVPAELPSEA